MSEAPKKVVHVEVLASVVENNDANGRQYKRYAIRDIDSNELHIVSVMPNWKCNLEIGTKSFVELKFVEAFKHGWYNQNGEMEPYKYSSIYFNTSVELTTKVANKEVEVGKLIFA